MKKGARLRFLQVVFLIVGVYIYQEFINDIGWKIALLFDYSRVDTDGTFMMVSVHHIVMALITLGILYILHRWKNIDFKINFKADAYGTKFTFIYCIACLVYYFFWYVIFGFLLDSIAEYNYEITTTNVLGTLGFQLFLSATEELIFRVLPIGCYKAVWGKSSKLADTVILLLTSLLFMYVHIYTGKPFLSQLYSLILVFIHGLMFGTVYLKSKSVVYPMIMHGVSNFISVALCYVYMILSHYI